MRDVKHPMILLALLGLSACGGARPALTAGAGPGSYRQEESYAAEAAGGRAMPASEAAPDAASDRAAMPAAPPPVPSARMYQPPAQERPGLGTVFGEERFAPVQEVAFQRHGSEPLYVAALGYNDARGVAAMRARAGRLLACSGGEPVFRSFRRDTAPLWGGVTIQVVDAGGQQLPSYHAGDRVLVAGEAGQRYAIQIENRTGQRFEIVASVDGLDVTDGKTASLGKRGYVVSPYGRLQIDGYRRSMEQVAAFRFGSVRDSYAAKTGELGDRHVGVIGVALFAEAGADWAELDREAQRREQADPFPGRFAQPPQD